MYVDSHYVYIRSYIYMYIPTPVADCDPHCPLLIIHVTEK